MEEQRNIYCVRTEKTKLHHRNCNGSQGEHSGRSKYKGDNCAAQSC